VDIDKNDSGISLLMNLPLSHLYIFWRRMPNELIMRVIRIYTILSLQDGKKSSQNNNENKQNNGQCPSGLVCFSFRLVCFIYILAVSRSDCLIDECLMYRPLIINNRLDQCRIHI
jgi:hypothetical protein